MQVLFITFIALSCLFPVIIDMLHTKGSIDVFKPVYPMVGFYFLLFVVKPSVLILNANPIAQTGAFSLALIYGFIGIVAFYIGYYAKIGTILARYIPSFKLHWSKKRLLVIIIVFTIISTGFLFYLSYGIIQKDVLFILMHSLQIQNQYLKVGGSYIQLGMSLFVVAFWMLYAYSISSKRVSKVVLITFFFGAILISLMSGLRWSVVTLLVVPIILRHYYLQKKVKVRHLILGIPMLFFLLTLLNLFRNYGKFGFSMRYFLYIPAVILSALKPFYNFATLIHAIPEKISFQYGLYYIYILITPIPRAIWSQKPITSVNIVLTKAVYGVGPSTITETFTMPGSFYFEFHILGIIIGMFIWGVLWKLLYSYLLLHKSNIGVVLIYAVLLLLGINCIRVSFVSFITSGLISVLPIILSILYVTKGKLIVRRLSKLKELKE